MSTTADLASLLPNFLPLCPFTLQSYPEPFICQCQAHPLDRLTAWAEDDDRHYVEIDAGGLYMRFPCGGPRDFRRIRIDGLLEEPFRADGELKVEYWAKVYKPILLTTPNADGERVMLLDKGLRVKYFGYPQFPEWSAPYACVDANEYTSG